MTAASLHDLTLADAGRLIAARKLSPVEYADALLARTEAFEPQLNAFITRTPEIARKEAQAAESEIAKGNHRGPLHGVPFAVKDIYDTAGILTSGHSRVCIDRVPQKELDGGQQVASGRRGADGQAGDARVRAWRAVIRSALAAGAQPLEYGTFHGRLLLGLGRGAGGGAGAGQPRIGYGRVDPRSRGAMWNCGSQTDIWTG